MASADETLYDRVFNLYGTNIDPQDWDFNINDGVAADLSDTMGEGWENPGSWDFVGDSLILKIGGVEFLISIGHQLRMAME